MSKILSDNTSQTEAYPVCTRSNVKAIITSTGGRWWDGNSGSCAECDELDLRPHRQAALLRWDDQDVPPSEFQSHWQLLGPRKFIMIIMIMIIMIRSTQAMMKTCQEEILVPATADNSAEVKVFVHRPKRLQGPRWFKRKRNLGGLSFLTLNMHNNVK